MKWIEFDWAAGGPTASCSMNQFHFISLIPSARAFRCPLCSSRLHSAPFVMPLINWLRNCFPPSINSLSSSIHSIPFLFLHSSLLIDGLLVAVCLPLAEPHAACGGHNPPKKEATNPSTINCEWRRQSIKKSKVYFSLIALLAQPGSSIIHSQIPFLSICSFIDWFHLRPLAGSIPQK